MTQAQAVILSAAKDLWPTSGQSPVLLVCLPYQEETQRMKPAIQDLIIIGGGVMGLCTAYYASQFTHRITLLEKSTIGVDNKEAAFFSYTRSQRNDYLDPFYARLAYEARSQWLDIQRGLRATTRKRSYQPFIIDCGCPRQFLTIFKC